MNALIRRWLLVVLSMATIASWFGAIDRRLAQEARRAIARSDQAFDEGHLRSALEEAFRASTSATLGAWSSRQSAERLRAIAVGSEATGRHRSALFAWYGLAAMSRDIGNASSGAARWGQESEQHIEYMLRKGIDVQESGVHQITHVPVIASGGGRLGSARCALLFLTAITLGAIGMWMLRRPPHLRVIREIPARLAVGTLFSVALFSWCFGWTFM
jgi:hypothetical protein